MMDATELARIGERMRAAQRTYYRTRSQSDLQASKALEKRFDDACREVLEQPSLFKDMAEDIARSWKMPGEPRGED